MDLMRLGLGKKMSMDRVTHPEIGRVDTSVLAIKRIRTFEAAGSRIVLYDMACRSNDEQAFLVAIRDQTTRVGLFVESPLFVPGDRSGSRWLFTAANPWAGPVSLAELPYIPKVLDKFVIAEPSKTYKFSETPRQDGAREHDAAIITMWNDKTPTAATLMCFELNIADRCDEVLPNGGFMLLLRGAWINPKDVYEY